MLLLMSMVLRLTFVCRLTCLVVQIYQPQFGMGNQLRALEAALAVARVLRRMLVVPDYMADNGEGRSRRGARTPLFAVIHVASSCLGTKARTFHVLRSINQSGLLLRKR